MTRNTLIGIGILVVVALIGYYVLTQHPRTGDGMREGDRMMQQGENMQMGEDYEAQGTITAIDTEGAMVDGPYLVTVEMDTGEPLTIAIPSMGILLCEAKDSIASIGDLSVGQMVEVRGEVGEDNMVIPCVGTEHYLRVAN